jgi:hypothetical protein
MKALKILMMLMNYKSWLRITLLECSVFVTTIISRKLREKLHQLTLDNFFFNFLEVSLRKMKIHYATK